jgi:hypothetical protein
MKIRNGFVSNSSSSSFVVAFPHKPTSAEDVKEMMFGKQEWHYIGDIYSEDDNTDAPTIGIAQKVFNKINKKATKKEMFEAIRNGWFSYYIDRELLPGMYESFEETKDLTYKNDKEKIEEIWAKGDKINDKRVNDIVKIFRENNKDKFFVVMDFSDNDGEEIEEHTDIFNRLEHIRTSYH